MKKAVMYGAGNIGRGFIAQVFRKSGYAVTFIDVAQPIVDELNSRGSYPIRTVSNDGFFEETIDNVCAVNGKDADAAASAIAECDIMATAVGVNIMPHIIPVIAGGIMQRGGRPINIVICENLMNAGSVVRDMLSKHLPPDVLSTVGCVETSIGRMVPTMTEKMQEGDILKVWVEPYCELPLDADGFVGEKPDLYNAKLFTPFMFYEERKLYIHNLGHATCAYLGNLYNCGYIYQAVAIPAIREQAYNAMKASAEALSATYGVDIAELDAHIEDLLHRFENAALADTVERVGRDPLRKLLPNDRFMGAIKRCKGAGLKYEGVLRVVAAALKFHFEDDPSSGRMLERIAHLGRQGFLKEHCQMDDDDIAVCARYCDEFAQS